jgi:putative protease
MSVKREDLEIMAPVGSYESLTAAIQGNADSVYFGVGRLNMRSKSTLNFTAADLKNIVNTCKENNKRTYLTLNSVLYDADLSEMKDTVDLAKENGITAIIASDQSVLNYAREKGVEVHLSTQLNIGNIETIKFYSSYADVMVLARELNMKQVETITKAIEKEHITGPSGNLVKIEMFAHGALCMAISGKCYLSLHEYGASANRGECFQICRRKYVVTDKETNAELEIDNEYIMSPKDLCTISFLDRLVNAGVRVLKIEGRARSAEYVKTVSQCYHEAALAYCNNEYSQEKIDNWMARLSTVYNRGFWDGYYLGRRLGEWSKIYGSKATKKKVYIGKGMNYFSNLGVAEFLIETGTLSIGDDIIVMGPTTGVYEAKIEELRVDLKQVNEAVKGERFSIPVTTQIRRSDKLYKLVDAEEFE